MMIGLRSANLRRILLKPGGAASTSPWAVRIKAANGGVTDRLPAAAKAAILGAGRPQPDVPPMTAPIRSGGNMRPDAPFQSTAIQHPKYTAEIAFATANNTTLSCRTTSLRAKPADR